jgi:hypothetical protein
LAKAGRLINWAKGDSWTLYGDSVPGVAGAVVLAVALLAWSALVRIDRRSLLAEVAEETALMLPYRGKALF